MTIVVLAGMCSLTLAGDVSTDFGGTVRKFSAARHKLDQELSAQLKLPLPPQADVFFRVAETGNWEAVSNQFEKVKEQGDYGRAIPELRNELWAPIHETIGIWEVWVGWKEDSSLLAMFYEPVLSSIPKGSIYFGGTDYGRFVITTVNAMKDPPPIFCITQNPLADQIYTAHLRAIYGKDIWLPQEKDSAFAFQRYVEEVQSGKRHENPEAKIENGKVQVSGALGVMEINGIIAEMIFEHNKDSHEFFVEESYVLNWMYPYLEPHGLIMKLNRQPADKLPEQVVAHDRDFWKRYVGLLESNPGFATNLEAQKAFAKLRSAIAGIYVYRKMYPQAEVAFRQAIRLCPTSPEASFRLAQMYEQQERFTDAQEVMAVYLRCCLPDFRASAEEYMKHLKDRIQKKNVPEPAR
jgi:tetratricopeptide (TPR) repeat protein